MSAAAESFGMSSSTSHSPASPNTLIPSSAACCAPAIAPASIPSSPSIPSPISAPILLPSSIASASVRLLRCSTSRSPSASLYTAMESITRTMPFSCSRSSSAITSPWKLGWSNPSTMSCTGPIAIAGSSLRSWLPAVCLSASGAPTWRRITRMGLNGARPGDHLPDELQRVPGGPPGPVLDLLPAGDPGRRDDRLRWLGPDGREEPEFADAHGQLVVLGLEAERAGHAAAPGVELDHLGARDAPQERGRGGGARERLLVAVAVEQHTAAADRIVLRQDQPAPGDGIQQQFLGQPG